MSVSKIETKDYSTSDLPLRISNDREVSWIRNNEVMRVPDQTKCRQSIGVNFMVCGAAYRNLSELYFSVIDKSRRLYQDVHGRYVLDMKERYPIFDSYDAACENRYYHWYLVLEANRLSMVYSDDGGGGIEITEDVRKLPDTPYRILHYWHYLDDEGILRLK